MARGISRQVWNLSSIPSVIQNQRLISAVRLGPVHLNDARRAFELSWMASEFPLFAFQKQHKNQTSFFPWRSADEQGAVFAQDGVTFDQDLLLTPDLEVQIDTAIVRRAFGVNFHEQIPGRNDPGFILTEDVLPVLAEDFEVLE